MGQNEKQPESQEPSQREKNDRAVGFGCKAVVAGTPDFGMNGEDVDGFLTDAGDTIANVLHAVHKAAGVPGVDLVLERARTHFEAELGELAIEEELEEGEA